MCGICGFTGEVLDRDKTLRRMTEVITHRGPDSDGFFMDKYISMGFRREYHRPRGGSPADLQRGQDPRADLQRRDL